MTQTSISHEAAHLQDNPSLSPRLTLRWALTRAILGITIMTVCIGGALWLTHATSDQTAQARANTIPHQ